MKGRDFCSPVYEPQDNEGEGYEDEEQSYEQEGPYGQRSHFWELEVEPGNPAWQIIDEQEKLSSNIKVNKRKKSVVAFVWRDEI